MAVRRGHGLWLDGRHAVTGPGFEAVHVTLSGAVQPDAESTGIGDPLAALNATIDYVVAAYAKATADAVASDPHWVTLDLTDPALRERLGRWQFDSERLGWTERSRNIVWLRDAHDQYLAWAVALLAELGRAG